MEMGAHMVRGNMMRMAWVAASVAMAMAGCNCPGEEKTCTDTDISWEAPTSDTVTSPFDVSFSVKVAGEPFTISAAQITIDGKTVDGGVSGARATFSGVTATAGSQEIVATIAQGTCSKTFPAKTVTVQGETCTTPTVSAVDFPQEAVAPVGVLNATELPQGTNLQVRVAATCTTGVQVRIKRGTEVVGPLTDFTAGVATVTTTLPDSDNARYDLFAELVKDGVAVNTVSGNPAASASIEVNRTPPSVALTVPSVFGPMDDANSGMAGFQARVTGTAPPDTECTFNVPTAPDPKQQTASPSTSGDVSADYTLVSGTYTVTLICTDTAGNSASATATFRVDFEPPTVTITSPANVDGGATMIVTQSPLPLTISTDAEDGSTVVVTRNGTEVDADTVSGGAATLTVSFGVDGTYTLAVTVTDLAGNSTTRSVVVVVTLDGCGAAFMRPQVCPVLITPAQMSNGTYSFQTASKSTCQGQPAALYRIDYLADGGVLAEVPSGTTTVGAGGISSFPPLTLTSGDYAFRAEITNLGSDAGVSVADSCRVTVDLDGPVITNPIVPGTSTFATVNVAQDTQPLVPGVQRSLTFSARVPMGGRVDVCTTQAIDTSRPASDGGFEMRPTSVECGAGWYVLQQAVTSPASGFSFPDGSYDVKVVVIGGGQVVSSPPVSILSDSVRPCVNGLSRVLPQDTNTNNRLSIAELGGAAPRLEFQLGCGDTPTTLAATNPLVVRDITGGIAGATRASTAAFASNAYTLTLTGAYATEIDLNLFIELTDLAGNKNLLNLPLDPATFTFRVDPVAPTCDIQSPGPSQTLIGQAGVTGGMFPVIVGTSSDVTTNAVRVTFGSTAARDLTPTNNVAQTSYSVTGTNTYSVTATCTDESGNQATATPRSITIDLDAPTCSISSPTAMTYSVNQISTAVSVAGAEGRAVTIRSSLQGAPLGTLTVGSGVATGNISYPNGTQTVTAEVSDAAGNLCSANVAGVVVNSTSCSLALTNAFTNSAGNWFNRTNTGSLGATSGVIASLNANSADCRSGQTVTLQRTLPTMGTVSTTTTAANGDASFTNVAVNDGETWTVTINNGTGILTAQTFRVGLRVPTATGVTINGNALTSGQDLFFVASSGNINLEPSAGTPKLTTHFADGVPGTAGSQTNVAITGINGTRYGADNGLVEVRYASGVVISQAVSAEPFDLASTQMNLAHNTTGAFVVRVTSAAGNTADIISSSAAVDVIAPAAPSVTQSLASARAATVNLSWNPVYDDGTDSSSGGLMGGPPAQLAGYDVRWTTSSVPSNNGMAAVTDFFGSSAKEEALTAWSSTTVAKALTLPPINDYRIAVRARDEMGNYSTFAQPAVVNNQWTTFTFSGVAGSGFGAAIAANSSVTGDGVNDLVVGAPARNSNVGSVFVYTGGSSLSAASTAQEIAPSDGRAGRFGADVSTSGNAIELASEGVRDLLVAAPDWYPVGTTTGFFWGRAFLFAGGASQVNTTSFVEFRADAAIAFGVTARIIKDIDGDGFDEVAIASQRVSSNQGRVYIFRGRTFANWQTARTATDSMGTPYVPVTQANWVLEGVAGSNTFGQNRDGLVELDLDGNGTLDGFTVPLARETINRVNLYSSATVNSSNPQGASFVTQTLGTATPLQVLGRAPGTNATFNGFGRAATTGQLFAGTGFDVVVTYPQTSSIFLYANLSSLGFASGALPPQTATAQIVGSNALGRSVASGFLNGDSDADLVIGEGGTTDPSTWVLFQYPGTSMTPVSSFDSNLISGRPFNAARLQITGTGGFGTQVGVSDVVSGDTVPELIIGDDLNAQVRIWR